MARASLRHLDIEPLPPESKKRRKEKMLTLLLTIQSAVLKVICEITLTQLVNVKR